MSIKYNADEIYEIGIQIEKNGKAFYEAVRDRTENNSLKTLFGELAEWENGHISIFTKLKSEIPAGTSGLKTFDPDGEMQKYLRAAAASHVFTKNINIAELVEKLDTPVKVLNKAMEFEKDSVVLYISMEHLVPVEFGKEQVKQLAFEELKHVSFIREQLDMLG